MNIIRQDLIKSASVDYSNSEYRTESPWYNQAALNIKGYEVKLGLVYYKTLDEATQGLKDRIQQALADFQIPTT